MDNDQNEYQDTIEARENSTVHFEYVREVAQALVRAFGCPSLGNKKNPFNELLYITLSNRTPPDSYQETYRELRRRFPRANDLAKASVEDVASAINLGGLHNKKAQAITAFSRELKRVFGRVSLAPVEHMETREAEQFLMALPGVSTKTARCVLMYSLDRPVFPVDRHCLRIVERLRWVPEGGELTKMRADEIQTGIPKEVRKELHVGMIVLGRTNCFPLHPTCTTCPCLRWCPTGQTNVGDMTE